RTRVRRSLKTSSISETSGAGPCLIAPTVLWCTTYTKFRGSLQEARPRRSGTFWADGRLQVSPNFNPDSRSRSEQASIVWERRLGVATLRDGRISIRAGPLLKIRTRMTCAHSQYL